MPKSKVPSKPVPVAELNVYLRKPESQGKTDREIALTHDTDVREVTRLRRQIKKETSSVTDAPVSREPSAVAEVTPPAASDLLKSSATNGESVSPSPEGNPLGQADPPPTPDILVEPGRRTVRMDQVDADLSRVRSINDRFVDEYAEELEAYKTTAGFPDLEIFWVTDIDPPRYVLTSGQHRRLAAIKAFGPTATWQADLKVGTLRDALSSAFKHNRDHGYRLTREDRVGQIERILQDDIWGKWNNSKIAELAGEGPNGRFFVKVVREEWHRKQGTTPPDKTLVERGGQVYEHKARHDHPRGNGDSSESDDLDTDQGDSVDSPGTEEITSEEKKQEVNDQYLSTIACREHIHPELLEDFDAAALAWKELQSFFSLAGNWSKRHRQRLGDDHPAWTTIQSITRIGRPWGGLGEDKSPPWSACSRCSVQGISTGLIEGKDPCNKCSGTGFTIRGSR